MIDPQKERARQRPPTDSPPACEVTRWGSNQEDADVMEKTARWPMGGRKGLAKFIGEGLAPLRKLRRRQPHQGEAGFDEHIPVVCRTILNRVLAMRARHNRDRPRRLFRLVVPAMLAGGLLGCPGRSFSRLRAERNTSIRTARKRHRQYYRNQPGQDSHRSQKRSLQ